MTHLLPAFGWMLGALGCFTLTAVASRELALLGHSTFQMQFLRLVVAAVILLPFIVRSRGRIARTGNFKLQLFRNVLHYLASLGWYYGLAVLPLATVFAIEFTTPLWLALIAALFLGERLNQGRLVALAMGFLGVLVIVRPGIADFGLASLIVLAAALGFGGSHASAKGLTRSDSVLTILFYMTFLQIPMGIVPALLTWSPMADASWFWGAAMGSAALAAHFCMTRALSLADATLVIPMDFLRVPLVALCGFLFYAERIDLFVMAGALLIFSGNYYSLRRERVAMRAQASSPT